MLKRIRQTRSRTKSIDDGSSIGGGGGGRRRRGSRHGGGGEVSSSSCSSSRSFRHRSFSLSSGARRYRPDRADEGKVRQGRKTFINEEDDDDDYYYDGSGGTDSIRRRQQRVKARRFSDSSEHEKGGSTTGRRQSFDERAFSSNGSSGRIILRRRSEESSGVQGPFRRLFRAAAGAAAPRDPTDVSHHSATSNNRSNRNSRERNHHHGDSMRDAGLISERSRRFLLSGQNSHDEYYYDQNEDQTNDNNRRSFSGVMVSSSIPPPPPPLQHITMPRQATSSQPSSNIMQRRNTPNRVAPLAAHHTASLANPAPHQHPLINDHNNNNRGTEALPPDNPHDTHTLGSQFTRRPVAGTRRTAMSRGHTDGTADNLLHPPRHPNQRDINNSSHRRSPGTRQQRLAYQKQQQQHPQNTSNTYHHTKSSSPSAGVKKSNAHQERLQSQGQQQPQQQQQQQQPRRSWFKRNPSLLQPHADDLIDKSTLPIFAPHSKSTQNHSEGRGRQKVNDDGTRGRSKSLGRTNARSHTPTSRERHRNRAGISSLSPPPPKYRHGGRPLLHPQQQQETSIILDRTTTQEQSRPNTSSIMPSTDEQNQEQDIYVEREAQRLSQNENSDKAQQERPRRPRHHYDDAEIATQNIDTTTVNNNDHEQSHSEHGAFNNITTDTDSMTPHHQRAPPLSPSTSLSSSTSTTAPISPPATFPSTKSERTICEVTGSGLDGARRALMESNGNMEAAIMTLLSSSTSSLDIESTNNPEESLFHSDAGTSTRTTNNDLNEASASSLSVRQLRAPSNNSSAHDDGQDRQQNQDGDNSNNSNNNTRTVAAHRDRIGVEEFSDAALYASVQRNDFDELAEMSGSSLSDARAILNEFGGDLALAKEHVMGRIMSSDDTQQQGHVDTNGSDHNIVFGNINEGEPFTCPVCCEQIFPQSSSKLSSKRTTISHSANMSGAAVTVKPIENANSTNLRSTGNDEHLSITFEQCHHRLCLSCLRNLVEAQIQSTQTSLGDIRCPECQVPLTQRELRFALGNDTFGRLERNALEQAVSDDPSMKHCPTPSCPYVAFIEPSQLRPRTGDNDLSSSPSGGGLRIDCPMCKKSSCVLCSASPYHAGITCSDYAISPHRRR